MKSNICKISVFLFLIFKYFPVFAFEPIKFVSSMNTGVYFGVTDEIVYKNSKKISQLTWDEKCIPIIDFAFQVSRGPFSLKTSLEYGLSVNSGNLFDYDFLNSNANYATNFSSHDAIIDKWYKLYALLDYSLLLNQKVTLNFNAGYLVSQKKWTGQNGYLQYPSIYGTEWTGTENKTILHGPVISYEQIVHHFIVGGGITYYPVNKITCSCGGFYAPYSYICTEDNHFLRMVQFYDMLQNGYMFEIYADCNYLITKNMSVCLAYVFEKQNFYDGITSSRSIGDNNDELLTDSQYSSEMCSRGCSFKIGLLYVL